MESETRTDLQLISLADVVDRFKNPTDVPDIVNKLIRKLSTTPNLWRLGPIVDIRELAKSLSVPEGELIVDVLRCWYASDVPAISLANVRDAIAVMTDQPCSTELARVYASDALVALAEYVDAKNQRTQRAIDRRAKFVAELDA